MADYLITNVFLEKESLDDKQIIQIYRQRWQIELYYRTFKQTFGKRKLRCQSADNAEQELRWSVIGLWMMLLSATHQQWEAGEALEGRAFGAGLSGCLNCDVEFS